MKIWQVKPKSITSTSLKNHHLEEAIDEIKAVTEKNKSFFQRFVNHEEVNAKEMRDFMEPYRFIKSKYILKKSSKS